MTQITFKQQYITVYLKHKEDMPKTLQALIKKISLKHHVTVCPPDKNLPSPVPLVYIDGQQVDYHYLTTLT